jgi:hypothetical protein
MPITVSLLLLIAAFLLTLAAITKRSPLWVPVLLVILERLLAVVPR